MFTRYMTLYTILVQKWGMGAYMVMGAYKVLYSSILLRFVILMNLIISLFHPFNVQGREPYVCN